MKKWISLFGVVFVTLWLAGCSAESNVKKGDKFYAIGEYFEAAAEYRKAYMPVSYTHLTLPTILRV